MVSKAILRVVSEPADLSNADVPGTFTVWEWTKMYVVLTKNHGRQKMWILRQLPLFIL